MFLTSIKLLSKLSKSVQFSSLSPEWIKCDVWWRACCHCCWVSSLPSCHHVKFLGVVLLYFFPEISPVSAIFRMGREEDFSETILLLFSNSQIFSRSPESLSQFYIIYRNLFQYIAFSIMRKLPIYKFH